MTKNIKRRGFTLIELLVVIAIINLLSSIILASLKSARDKAMIAAGQTFASHLNQVYGADAGGIWDFDEGAGTIAADTSGNNNTITVPSSAWTTGIHGTGVSLSAQVNANVGTGYNTSTGYTIAFWIKPNAINSSGMFYNGLFRRETYLNDGFRIGITQTGAVQYWTSQSGGTMSFASLKKISTDRFYHVAVTCDGSKAIIYIDGSASASQSGVCKMPAAGTTLGIDAFFGGSAASANAVYDEIRYYTQTLTAESIYNIYADGAAKHYAVE